MLLNLYCFLSTLKADRKGVTALEYALMGSLIALAIITAVTGLATKLSTQFTNMANAL